MATNGNPHTDQYWNGDRPLYDSFETWLESKGKDAYKDFKKGHPTTKLSYEGWRQSDQVYGGYIFYVASLVWNEDGDSVRQHTNQQIGTVR